MAEALGVNKSVVCTWMTTESCPGWRSICEISYVFQVPIRGLITNDPLAIKESRLEVLAVSSMRNKPRKAPTPTDNGAARALMLEVANGEHPQLTTVASVAKRLGVELRGLRRRLPHEVRRLAEALDSRRQLALSTKHESRARTYASAAVVVGQQLAKEGKVPTRREVERRFADLGLPNIRWTEAKTLLTQVRQAMSETKDEGQAASR
jgi:hypothetical protein